MTDKASSPPLVRLARAALFIMLLSRGFLYCLPYTLGPYSSVLWYEDFMMPIVEGLLGYDYLDYAMYSEPYINGVMMFTGSLLILSAFFVLFLRDGKFLKASLLVTAVLLIFHAICRYFDSDFELPMLMEYGIQSLAPLAYFMYLRKGEFSSGIRLFCTIGIALCFLGHGLYAAGFPYQPVKFPFMVEECLFLTYDQASVLVKVAGYIDFVLVVMVFIPKVRIWAFAYMCFWGLLTATARVVAYSSATVDFYGIHPWLWETTVRFIHGLAPLIMCLYYRHMKKA